MFRRKLFTLAAGVTTTAVLAITVSATTAMAADFTTGPVIENYGPAIPVADKDTLVETDREYRVVFDAASHAGTAEDLNQELETVARFMNMHALNGVPAERMDLAVVIHGEALKSVLDDAAHRQRYGVPNPSLELLTSLHEKGVAVYVCGQSMGLREVRKEELAAPARVTLSAMTMLVVLQSEGYALVP